MNGVSRPGPALWGQACAVLRGRIGERNFATWIAQLRPTWVDGGLALAAPDAAARERVARHFLRAIEDAVADVAGRAYPIRVGLSSAQATLPLRLRPPTREHTFDTFVRGQSNAGALATARALLDGTSTGPLFLHGPSGVGKTHLLHAIFHGLEAPGVLVACLPAAQVVEALVGAYQARADNRFWSDLAPLGALLLDDVHSIRGLDQTQARLMDGLRGWVEAGRLLVVTSDRPPEEMPALVARFGERFSGGLVASIARPEPALRLAILEQKSRAHGITLDERLADRLAHALGGNVRRLEGGLTRLLAHARLSGRTIDEALAREVLPELAREPALPLTLERIAEATADAFRVHARRVRGRGRTGKLLAARQVTMYLARRLLGRSFAELAAWFGCDHTTVLHACRTVGARLERDPALRSTVARLEQRLRGGDGP